MSRTALVARAALLLALPGGGGRNTAAWLASWAKAFNKEPLTRRFFKCFENALEAVRAIAEEQAAVQAGTAAFPHKPKAVALFGSLRSMGVCDGSAEGLPRGQPPWRRARRGCTILFRIFRPLFLDTGIGCDV